MSVRRQVEGGRLSHPQSHHLSLFGEQSDVGGILKGKMQRV